MAGNSMVGKILRTGLKGLGRRRLPRIEGELRLPGLHGEVEIIRDRWGVPHIYAADTHDLFYAHGVVHAQDRLWQMELHRRLAHGRLSELVGEAALDTDRTVRTLGFGAIGRQDWTDADDEVREVVTAYCAGVNGYLEHGRGRLPVEFTLLRHRPEPWCPEDTMCFARVMAWELSHAWYGQLVRSWLVDAVGEERAAELRIDYPVGNPVTLPLGIEEHPPTGGEDAGAPQGAASTSQGAAGASPGAASAPPGSAASESQGAVPSDGSGGQGHGSGAEGIATATSLLDVVAGPSRFGLTSPFLAQGLGSNVWALSGRRTASGTALLCNDMHLPLSLPSLWYLAHLEGGPFRVTGVGVPGLPPVLVGHNADVAWGMTLAYTDCEDLFVEEFIPELPTGSDPSGRDGRPRYRCGDAWLEADVRREAIVVKGRKEPHVEDVVVTRHGPVVSDVVGSTRRVALQSMALRPNQALRGWLWLDRAAGWDDFVAANRLVDAPQLNVAYADTAGNIGLWVTGTVPLRPGGAGAAFAGGQGLCDGASGAHEWTGSVPFAQMPHALNPAQGYVVSCNNRLMPDDYPYRLGDVWMSGFRARRIVDVVEGTPRMTVADCAALQMDCTCLPGLEFIARLDEWLAPAIPAEDADVTLALDLLRGWDGALDPDSVGGSVYEVTRRIVVRRLLEPALGADLTDAVVGRGFHPLLQPASEFYGHDTTTLLRLLDDSSSWWVGEAGGRAQLLRLSLAEAVVWLRGELGPEAAAWKWGRLHRATFPHALGLKRPLDQVFDRGPVPVGGDTDTPCQTASALDGSHENSMWAPSFRQIVDMGDLSRSVVVHPPGQSGMLGSPHYDDLIGPWTDGVSIPMLWDRAQVDREAEGTLYLRTAPLGQGSKEAKE